MGLPGAPDRRRLWRSGRSLSAIGAVGLAFGGGVLAGTTPVAPSLGMVLGRLGPVSGAGELLVLVGVEALAALCVGTLMIVSLRDRRSHATEPPADLPAPPRGEGSDILHGYEQGLADILNRLSTDSYAYTTDRAAAVKAIGNEFQSLNVEARGIIQLYDARAGELDLVPFDLAIVIDEYIEQISHSLLTRLGITIEAIRIDESIIRGKATLIRTLVSNLISNAAKYIPAETTGRPPRIEVSCINAGRDAHVYVHDSGPGIPASERTRIFEANYRIASTRSLPGTGRGLHIVKGIVEAHGGVITVEDSHLLGACFHLKFPLVADPPAAGPA